MSGQRKWWSGHELYGCRIENGHPWNACQEYSYIDLGPWNKDEIELDYWKSMYPEKIKRIQQRVEDICEEMDYVNSPMYDEYPDRIYLRTLGSRIYDEMTEDEEELSSTQKENDARKREWESKPHFKRMPEDGWLRDVIDVLLFQEMHRRRCRRGRCKRRWY